MGFYLPIYHSELGAPLLDRGQKIFRFWDFSNWSFKFLGAFGFLLIYSSLKWATTSAPTLPAEAVCELMRLFITERGVWMREGSERTLSEKVVKLFLIAKPGGNPSI